MICVNKMKFGIIKENDKIIDHVSLLKILLNPILKKIHLQIVSCFKDEKFSGYEIRRY